MATILIVDDRAICREFLVKLLGYYNHTLFQANDGVEALKIIHQERPELIITDLLMPTMNGYELVKAIKSFPEFATIPVIFYTASFLLCEAKLLAETCGVAYVLFKPSEPELIMETINKALGLKKTVAMIDNVTTKPYLSEFMSELEFNKDEFKLIMTTARRSAKEGERLMAISEKLSQAFNQLDKTSNQLVAMAELNLSLLSERDPEQLIQLFCNSACNILECKYCVIGILDNSNVKLKRFAISKSSNVAMKNIESSLLDCSLVKQTLASKDVLQFNHVNDAQKKEFDSIHPIQQCFLGARLITACHLYGFIYFTDKIDQTEFNESDIKIVSTLASEVAILYENNELYETIQSHAVKLQISMNECDKNKLKTHSS